MLAPFPRKPGDDWNLPVPKRVALVGLGGSSWNYVNEVDAIGNRKDKFDEVWTMNSYCNVIESDRLWHMDNIEVQRIRAKGGNVKVKGFLKAMKEYKGPIYTSVLHPDYPNLVQYPLMEIAQKLGSLYFTSTPAYAIAYAIYIGVEEISLYGLDYTWPGMAEVELGRSCAEYWIGQGSARGVKFKVAPFSSLMEARVWSKERIPLYGYDGFRAEMYEGPEGSGLKFVPEPLPTAEEIEIRYSHKPQPACEPKSKEMVPI